MIHGAHIGTALRIQLNRQCAAAMRPFCQIYLIACLEITIKQGELRHFFVFFGNNYFMRCLIPYISLVMVRFSPPHHHHHHKNL